MDAINPQHYKSHPSGVECIIITEPMGFNLGNAVKYIWRTAFPGGRQSRAKALENLRKAHWYIGREIARMEAEHGSADTE